MIKTIASIWGVNMPVYFSLDIICSSKLIVFLELRSRKTVRISEQIMSVDKYPRIFSRQMEAIVHVFVLQMNRLDRFSRIAHATMFSKRAGERKPFSSFASDKAQMNNVASAAFHSV